jgi:hypothetical protein
MKFNEPLTDHVPPAHLLNKFGGTVEFEYDHTVYWPALIFLCEQRRNMYKARWEKAGKVVGENEAYLRGGDVKCVSGEFFGTEA